MSEHIKGENHALRWIVKQALPEADGMVTYQNVIKQINRIRTDLAAANAIIERMPKTADGVPIEIGNVYYYLDWANDSPPLRSQSVQAFSMRIEMIEIDSQGSVSYYGPCSVPWRKGTATVTIEDASDLYSTREAAEAAREGGEA